MSERDDTSNLNRHNRRALKRSVFRSLDKEVKRSASKPQEQVVLHSIDTLLESNGDIDFYTQELAIHQQALKNLRLGCQYMRVLRNIGVSEESMRQNALDSLNENYDRRRLSSSMNVLNALGQQMDTTRRFIADDAEVWTALVGDRSILLDDLYQEAIRSRQETVDLLGLQTEWLQQLEPEENPDQQVDESELPAPGVDTLPQPITPFTLEAWELYRTSRKWSFEPQHLIRIPTGSRREALEHMTSTLFGEIMIKPVSVLNALEFYLHQDILQRAMAARLKYVPEHMRDWIKIKRGRGRILLLVPEEGRAVFFAGNRDEIYRNI